MKWFTQQQAKSNQIITSSTMPNAACFKHLKNCKDCKK